MGCPVRGVLKLQIARRIIWWWLLSPLKAEYPISLPSLAFKVWTGEFLQESIPETFFIEVKSPDSLDLLHGIRRMN